MSSVNFTSSFPRRQNNQNESFWNPISPLTSKSSLTQNSHQASLTPNPLAAYNRRQSEYPSRVMANSFGTIPVPNFHFDGKRPPRITSPLSNIKPIGFERNISRQMGYSSFCISEVGEEVPSVEEESGGESPIITQSLVRGMHPVQHGASNSMQEDDMSVLDLENSFAGLNVNEGASPSRGKKSYGTLNSYHPYAQTQGHAANTGMQPPNFPSGHRDITAIFQGPQVQNSLPLRTGASYASSGNIPALVHRAVEHEHKRSITSFGGPEQHMSQFNAQVFSDPSTINDDYTIKIQTPPINFEHQNRNTFSIGSNNSFQNAYPGSAPTQPRSMVPHHNKVPTVSQTPDQSSASFPSSMRPTGQLLREQGLLAPLPSHASNPTNSNHLNSNHTRDSPSKFLCEAHLPPDLNCAVWIQGIPKAFERQFLYQKLFNAISIGPIVAAYICLGGDQHSSHAAKVVFKHAEHAIRLRQQAHVAGIYMHGNRLRVEANRHGQREYPLRLHYRSRVILLEVFNHAGMDLAFWTMFISNLGVDDMENCRYLSYSSPRRMVMEFRFARIFGQASVLLAGIRANAAFEGIVTARYAPDVRCDVCDMY
ncbi:hypothetical protein BCIN_03g08300 [Botrytis cinerea B05.10]|uniref:RRM domain-containing protein n=1 Tax=Botryotinia fuckeliana (strain B05.10) TaxID=332648 RepID=A0A384JDT3_BOTFB|nr:hypothetical protein BCIN_03g08300 [Botrytis cinerea B05.10]ATZ48640.1 hypothetical protein BCIN_03g08300 [Botrytis cinerea B05.10]